LLILKQEKRNADEIAYKEGQNSKKLMNEI
jgi:hypothetical protein